MCFIAYRFESQPTNKKNLYSNSDLTKMSGFFKNCWHLYKATACNLTSFLVLMICINLTEKNFLSAVDCYKNKNFSILIYADEKRDYEMLTLQ